MKEKTVIIWSTYISDLLDGKVTGIGVQLYLWARTFVEHGWRVVSYTSRESLTKEGIIFKHYGSWGKLRFFYEWVKIINSIVFFKPSLIISRGTERAQYALAVLSKMFRIKYVFFAASDKNFEKDFVIAGGKINTILFKRSYHLIKYFVVQNEYQRNSLAVNYNKNSFLLFNIWKDFSDYKSMPISKTDVLWVANLRRLKRAEWLINAAKVMPEYSFTIVGGRFNDAAEAAYYTHIEEEAKVLENVHFLGPKDLAETNDIVSQARLLCCTSTHEGFPNTFLQAWSNSIPVISTVNPSDVITEHNLGSVVEDEINFQQQIKSFLEDQKMYDEVSSSIKRYFRNHHDADSVYEKFISWINM